MNKESFDSVFEKLKEIMRVDSDRRIALALDMHSSQISLLRKTKKIPYEKIVKYCLENNVSADSIFGIQVKREEYATESESLFPKHRLYCIPYLKNESNYIRLAGVEQNAENSLRAIRQNNNHVIVDTGKTKLIHDGVYAFHHEDYIFVRKFTFNVLGETVTVSNLDEGENQNKQQNLSFEDAKNFKMIGLVTDIITDNKVLSSNF